MKDQFSRLKLMIKEDDFEKIKKCKVAIFGIGGVGGYVCDGLARSGVEHFLLVDDDTLCITNINRQIIANLNTIGKYKVDVMKEHLLQINPNIQVETKKSFYLPENSSEFQLSQYDYVIDAMDTVTAKIELICQCYENHIKIISCMGCGNKMDPSKLVLTDIYKTSICPLAKVMRRELKKRRIKRLKVLYSKETPKKVRAIIEEACDYQNQCPKKEQCHQTNRRQTPGSSSFVPSVAGYFIASEVIKELIYPKGEER